jgi:hypothetical protein
MAKKKGSQGQGESWTGAHAIIRKDDGTTLNGTVLGRIKTKVSAYLELKLDWGSTLVDERKIADAHYS